jgi:protein-S-isoprenylcysteine O-methyltransferase Ste14
MKLLVLFSLTLTLEFIYLLLFILTIRLPGFRFWPPPSHRSWQFFFSWFIAGLVAANFLFIGLLDFDSFFLPHLRSRLPFALAFFFFGFIIGSWAFSVFGLRATIGLGDKLLAKGPYRYSRNPQYIGDSLHIIGYMIFTNSWMVWVIGILGVLLNALAPFTEESWLEERFGTAYLEYKRKTPRFIGFGRKTDSA